MNLVLEQEIAHFLTMLALPLVLQVLQNCTLLMMKRREGKEVDSKHLQQMDDLSPTEVFFCQKMQLRMWVASSAVVTRHRSNG